LSDPAKRRIGVGLKVVVVSAAAMLVSCGLCGLGLYQDRSVYDGAPSWGDTLGWFGLWISGFCLLVGASIAVVEIAALRPPQGE
jgi:hypothetical protein